MIWTMKNCLSMSLQNINMHIQVNQVNKAVALLSNPKYVFVFYYEWAKEIRQFIVGTQFRQ